MPAYHEQNHSLLQKLLNFFLVFSSLCDTFIKGFDANILCASGTFVETFWVGELAVVFVCSPLSVWNTIFVESGGGGSVDGRNSAAISFFQSLFEFAFEDGLEFVVLGLWVSVDSLVGNYSGISIDRFFDILELKELLILGKNLGD